MPLACISVPTQLLDAAIRYGGCEVVALPTLLTGRRYILYCPTKAVDAAKHPLYSMPLRFTGILAAGLTAIVGVYFLFVRDLLATLEVPDPITPLWALVLLVPGVLLIGHARRAS